MSKVASKVLIVFVGTLVANLATLWALGMLDVSPLRRAGAWLEEEAFEDELEDDYED